MQIWPNETGFGSGNYRMSETKKKWLVSQWWLCLVFTNVICQLDVLWPDYEAFHYKLLIQRFYGPRGKTRREVDRKFRRKNKRKSIANNRAIWSVMLCIWRNLLLHHSIQSQTWILLLHMGVRHLPPELQTLTPTMPVHFPKTQSFSCRTLSVHWCLTYDLHIPVQTVAGVKWALLNYITIFLWNRLFILNQFGYSNLSAVRSFSFFFFFPVFRPFFFF